MSAGGGLKCGWLLPSALVLILVGDWGDAVLLTPPYFNLAEGRRISATATCGEETQGPELYCKLVGANADRDVNINLIQGQVCDYCDPSRPEKRHPPEYAVDGAESWWQSPPLSRGMKYNEVNLTIDLGQEFHVAYVFIKMANSPRPGVWVLERSLDNGETYQPWQYFADTLSDCEAYFGHTNFGPITRDDSVVCETQYSKVVPLEGGEIVVSLLNNRPSSNDFFNSTVLQEWTRATNIRLRFLRTKTLLGHLMSVARQDPTVTRRYFYSIKDISIGGRCVCNGHADRCDITDPNDAYKLLCRCQHNTCGANCDTCCPGFKQKAWRLSKSYKRFTCERCNCFGHSEECVYDAKVDEDHLSLDLQGHYEGGGVCQNCRDNTEGINCNRCAHGYYRPYGKSFNQTDVCQRCDCEFFYSTGNCDEGTGACQCKPEFTGAPLCDSCSYGYFGYPECRPCECHLNGTRGEHCEAYGGQCPCKQNYGGKFCNQCAEGFYNFPVCSPCACNVEGSLIDTCHIETGQCSCKNNFGNRTCSQCEDGYYNYPSCLYCNCDVRGTLDGVCNKVDGKCLCKEGYGGDRCDQCIAGFFGYPSCVPCACSETGSASTICDATGKCNCLYNFAGRTCDQCSPGYYQYPDCLSCNCDSQGAIGVSCDTAGKCQCRDHFDGNRCNQCKERFYNFPLCEECNCDPTGILATFGGCGTLPAGELCQCKDRVHGRICNECKPLFWNLQAANPEGCEACDCHLPGVMGGIGVCDVKSGQCMCKSAVASRRCDQCADGTYNLQEDNLFGCTDCNCDIGGSEDNNCNKETGQCFCRPRINGQTCSEPLQTHYFPTLYQYLYEAEDGRTPANTPARYGFDQEVFPEYSWKGYAVFSQLQNELIQDIYISKPSLYRMVLRYINRNQESIIGTVTIIPDNPADIEQKFQVMFKPSETPALVTVSGATGGIPSPMVMNPGRWSISIKNEKSLFLDYFVLLPAAFYEATILVEQVETPCEVGNLNMCRRFSYPNLTRFDIVRGDGGFRTEGNDRDPLVEYFTDREQLRVVQKNRMPLINGNQPEIHLNLQVTKPGKHVLLINYLTPANDRRTSTVNVEASSQRGRDKGKATLYACPYTSLCPQAVIDMHGRVAVFNFDTNFISVILKGEENSNVAIDSVIAIPLEDWSLDYQQPKSLCVSVNGKCVQTHFPTPPDSKKVEFELGNEDQVAKVLPRLIDNTTRLIYLDNEDSMIDIIGKVPHPGPYVFVVHYYQPDYPAFDLDVLVHNGQVYEAILPVQHCPSNSGCRSIVRQADKNNRFSLTENFVFTLKEAYQKGVWLDYVLVIPADQYTENVLEEEPVDHTSAFINECGKNHFNIETTESGFCRDSVFSLTADYNNGALSCSCDFDGSLSFTCEKYGGQCQCKPNVIGRRCEACQTGFYGFPDCRACDCPSTALCETNTGACICPPRVTGERCDQCEVLTYGFDPIIGCEECNCEWMGVERGNLQCDLMNGSCKCKDNVVGRTCDRCQAGNWAYPNCQPCDCDLRGTTLEICDQYSAECFCKNNVEGQACDLCKPGTFNIEEKNEEGCTKCFCSGKTSRCSSSSILYRAQVSRMDDWTLATVTVDSTITVKPLSTLPEKLDSVIGADLTLDEAREKVVYFAAPEDYLGNKLTSYGGVINYTVFYTSGQNGGAVSSPDVIIYTGDLYLLHFALEQPPPALYYATSLDLIDTNFLLPNGFTASREQIMQVLVDLQGILIRATYWTESVTTRLQDVSLEISTEGYNPNATKALSVEQCQCPPNYKGHSCEECAAGYYRSQTGPFGGFCIPCQCNGHSDTCDVHTGICMNCKHDTTGNHCEQCAVGHHGNATTGTPMDCLICACPLPIASNNFATACEVSPHGDRISCECIDGYYGARCESCSAGFFGKPEVAGDFCQLCQCSGNINPEDPSSCDSVSGDCLQCLNNTFGQACSLCRPGYFGDAVTLKDCQTCDCDECGTKQCNSYNGQCECNDNVIGEKCDRCDVEHFGFESCQGCQACDCQNASESKQCDDTSGQCRCKPGVTGRTCDRCMSGFWNYGPEGCVNCGCNTEYSVGFGCNSKDGQCECLPGVIGEKCDHCPYRWVLIPDDGCFECDTCSHNLLDVTDELRGLLYPIVTEFESVAKGYFTTQRLTYINVTVNQLQEQVEKLDPLRINLKPITHEVESLEQDMKNLNKRADYAVGNGEQLAPKGNNVRKDALEEEKLIKKAVHQARMTVVEVISLGSSLESGTGQQIDSALQEAQTIINEIQERDFSPNYDDTTAQLQKAEDLLLKINDFSLPVANQSNAFENLREQIENFDTKINDIRDQSTTSIEKANKVNMLNEQNKRGRDHSKVETLKNAANEANMNLDKANKHLINASGLLNEAKQNYDKLSNGQVAGDVRVASLNETIVTRELELQDIQEPVRKAEIHASDLVARAAELDNLLKESRATSNRGIGAANAYKNIVNGTQEALKAAHAARNAAENATRISDGLGDRTGESEARSAILLQDARNSLNKAQRELEPKLAAAKIQVAQVVSMNKRSDEGDNIIIKALERVPAIEEVGPNTKKAIDEAEIADQKSREALEGSSNIILELPQEMKKATQLVQDVEATKKAIVQSSNQMEKMRNVVPNISYLMASNDDKLVKQRDLAKRVDDKIRQLKNGIALARTQIKGVKVGVTFSPNTVLQLKNPENLPLLGTSTRVSTYFKTNKPNGFLLYLGNEVGTQNRIRRTTTDDFVALEIENGYPVLTIDLGSGAERIISDKFVADNIWYQAIIDRTGKAVKLTIREETDDGREKLFVKDQVLKGMKSILNLDQENSKLFVGGYSNSFEMQKDVKYGTFEGQMEDLIVGDVPVSLWNFEDGVNNNIGSKERDKLVNLQPSTGFRFDGHGYVSLESKSYQMTPRTSIQLEFKTFASNGLLFFTGINKTSYLSITIEAGFVVYQYELGGGGLALTSLVPLNDGKWHTVDAVRDGLIGKLTVDGAMQFSGTSEGTDTQLIVSDKMYFGGYPHRQDNRPIATVDFEGCIDKVQIAETLVDLSRNSETLGVISGCPVRVASLVAFDENNPGYLRWPNATAPNHLQLTFKFKTTSSNGLLFLATNKDKSSTMSLSLVNGGLVLKSGQEMAVTKPTTKYNDSEWHVITATHSQDELRLDIDDYETFRSNNTPPPLKIAQGSIYFGGVPRDLSFARTIGSQSSFIGCLGDATANGVFINFANATDTVGAIIGKCESDEQGVTPVKRPSGPGLPIVGEVEKVEKPDRPVTPVSAKPDMVDVEEPDTTEETLHSSTTSGPTHAGLCALPLHPDTNSEFKPINGHRFGTVSDSHLEYESLPGKVRSKYDFSLSFKTYSEEGIIFYVADKNHVDTISLYMMNGTVHYSFNCGSGSALISTAGKYNDGLWHNVTFSRLHKNGALVVDEESVSGESGGSTKTLNVHPPFYLGGVALNIRKEAKLNMKGINGSFEGCLRHFKMSNLLVPSPMKSIGVIPCSDKEEQGVYFSADGGYIKARPVFRVGLTIDIKMDIKPRTKTALLLTVHSQHDYLVLQMVNGAIKFSVDNGKGPISAMYNPANEHYFCDGNWHSVQAVKTKNVVTLLVDKIHVDNSIGGPGASATDTRHPLYIGGNPPRSRLIRGRETLEQYVGCMKNVMINDKEEKFATWQVIGNVTTSFCPTN